MKVFKKRFFFILVLLSFNFYSQETTIDKIARETCEYLESEEMKGLDVDRRNEKLGLFILNLYNENEAQLNSEGIIVSFSDGSDSSSKFGEKVGMNMAKFCPEVLMALAEGFEEDEDVEEQFEISGELIDVVGTEFSTVILKDEEGKTQKFLWLQNFKGSDTLIQSLNNLDHNKVVVYYKNIECYAPQLNDYIIRKVIVEIIFVE